MNKANGALLEPIATNKWSMSGPWNTYIIERVEEGSKIVWTVHEYKDGGPNVYKGRLEGALSDAYSRAMGFTH